MAVKVSLMIGLAIPLVLWVASTANSWIMMGFSAVAR
jgi:hypothetical protein